MNNTYRIGFLYTVLSQIAILAAGLLSSVFVVRLLGPEKYGEYAYLSLIISIGWLFSNIRLGISSAYYTSSNAYHPRVLIVISLISALLTGGITVFVILLFLSLSNNSPVKSISIGLILIFSFQIPFMLGKEYLLGILRGLKLFGKFNIIRAGDKYIRLIIILLIILMYGDLLISKLIIIDTFTIFIFFIFTLIMGLSNTKKIYPQPNQDKNFIKAFKEVHVYGGWTFLNYLVLSMYGKIDRIFVIKIMDTASLGKYSVAVRIAELMWIFTQSLQVVLLPKLTETKDKDRIESIFIILQVSFLLLIVSSIAFLFIGTYCIPYIYGESYIDSVAPFQILVIGITFYSLHKVLATYYFAIGKVSIVVVYSVMALLLNTVLSYFLINKLGLIGGALSTTISYIFVTFLILFRFMKETKKNLWSVIFPPKTTFSTLFSMINLKS